MSHITCTNEPCHKYEGVICYMHEWVMTHMYRYWRYASCHICERVMSYTNEPGHMYEWFMCYICEWVTTHMYRYCEHLSMEDKAAVLAYLSECVMLHICMSHVKYTSESCGTCMNESWHTMYGLCTSVRLWFSVGYFATWQNSFDWFEVDPMCCCSVLQCVAVCCGVLQCVAVCCSVLQCVAVCCSVLQCAAVCCSVLQYGLR